MLQRPCSDWNRNPLKIIVSDVRMPEMDGAQLLTRVAQDYPHMVRFVLSGQAEKVRINQLVGAAHQYFTKPCETGALYQAVCRVVERRQAIGSSELLPRLTGLTSIPCQASHLQQLEEELSGGGATLEDATQIIASDLGLSTKVLQVVNSSFFGHSRTANDVSSACKSLGVDLLTDIFTGGRSIELWTDQSPAELETLVHLATPEIPLNQFLAGGSLTDSGIDPQASSILEFLLALWGIRAVAGQQSDTSPSPLPAAAARPLPPATPSAMEGQICE